MVELVPAPVATSTAERALLTIQFLSSGRGVALVLREAHSVVCSHVTHDSEGRFDCNTFISNESFLGAFW